MWKLIDQKILKLNYRKLLKPILLEKVDRSKALKLIDQNLFKLNNQPLVKTILLQKSKFIEVFLLTQYNNLKSKIVIWVH